MIKFNGIRQAVYGLNHYRYVEIYFNIETHETWADEFFDGRSCLIYRNENIRRLDFSDVYNYDEKLARRIEEHFDSGRKWNCELLTEVINKYIEYLNWWNAKMEREGKED